MNHPIVFPCRVKFSDEFILANIDINKKNKIGTATKFFKRKKSNKELIAVRWYGAKKNEFIAENLLIQIVEEKKNNSVGTKISLQNIGRFS